ncbi:MAG: DeoR family transcriptional regulator, partial [Dethiobacteria bacterium]
MNKQQRINRIVAILRDKNGESIKELANQLGVTEMTIRRDIKHLQESRIVRVVSGAVIYNG